MRISDTKIPKLTLVGAGPGDPELLTIKGAKSLSSADVVLYDALVNVEILKFAPGSAQKIYVGKRCGKHKFSQEKINEMIVDYAFNYGHVVRLKGGDPFVYGRGAEEVSYASTFGIRCEVIPGISSAIAVPSSAGIPVTERQIAESFWTLTATTKHHELSKDIALAARSSATMVILMGVNKIREIVSIFRGLGKLDTPVAIIQEGTTPNQVICSGEMNVIEQMALDYNIEPPAIIVIGEVVRHNCKAFVERADFQNAVVI